LGAELTAQPVVAGLRQHLALTLGRELAGDVGGTLLAPDCRGLA
jgi:hypothetical protein